MSQARKSFGVSFCSEFRVHAASEPPEGGTPNFRTSPRQSLSKLFQHLPKIILWQQRFKTHWLWSGEKSSRARLSRTRFNLPGKSRRGGAVEATGDAGIICVNELIQVVAAGKIGGDGAPVREVGRGLDADGVAGGRHQLH